MAKIVPSTIVKAARRALKPLGFAPFNEYYVAASLSPDASAFVSLGATRSWPNGPGTEFLIQASFGLRIHSLHRLSCSLAGWGDSPDFIAIGYRPPFNFDPPRQKTWPVTGQAMAQGIGEFAEDVEYQILPVIMQVATPEAICRIMLDEDNETFSWPNSWWTPVAHIVLGENEEAIRAAEAELALAERASCVNESYVKNYRHYVAALHSQLKGG